MKMNFDIDCLRTFALVSETMSFSRAAERVHRSQSTVSQQITKLEEQLGKPLIVRRKGRVLEITAEGRKLLLYASRILQLNDEAYSSLFNDQLAGFVRLGVPVDFFGRNFTSWLAKFEKLNPMVELEVESDQSDNVLRRTKQGEFDLAFFKQDPGAHRGNIVLREQIVWAAGKNFLVSPEEPIPLVLFPDGCAYRRHALSALRRHGISSRLSFVSPSFECLKTAVEDGLGITALARSLVTPDMRVLGHRIGLPSLPVIELAFIYGRQETPRVVTELAHYLIDNLTNAGPPHRASAA